MVSWWLIGEDLLFTEDHKQGMTRFWIELRDQRLIWNVINDPHMSTKGKMFLPMKIGCGIIYRAEREWESWH